MPHCRSQCQYLGKHFKAIFSQKGQGFLPGEIDWDCVEKRWEKLDYNTGLAIEQAKRVSIRSLRISHVSPRCLLLKGRLEPGVGHAFIVEAGNDIEA